MSMIIGLYKEQYLKLKEDGLLDYLFTVINNESSLNNIFWFSILFDICWSNTPQGAKYWKSVHRLAKLSPELIYFDRKVYIYDI